MQAQSSSFSESDSQQDVNQIASSASNTSIVECENLLMTEQNSEDEQKDKDWKIIRGTATNQRPIQFADTVVSNVISQVHTLDNPAGELSTGEQQSAAALKAIMDQSDSTFYRKLLSAFAHLQPITEETHIYPNTTAQTLREILTFIAEQTEVRAIKLLPSMLDQALKSHNASLSPIEQASEEGWAAIITDQELPVSQKLFAALINIEAIIDNAKEHPNFDTNKLVTIRDLLTEQFDCITYKEWLLQPIEGVPEPKIEETAESEAQLEQNHQQQQNAREQQVRATIDGAHQIIREWNRRCIEKEYTGFITRGDQMIIAEMAEAINRWDNEAEPDVDRRQWCGILQQCLEQIIFLLQSNEKEDQADEALASKRQIVQILDYLI